MRFNYNQLKNYEDNAKSSMTFCRKPFEQLGKSITQNHVLTLGIGKPRRENSKLNFMERIKTTYRYPSCLGQPVGLSDNF